MIEIVEYREQWPAEFRAIAGDLRRRLGPLALRIDHIGSTSVPGLAAKDRIDIQVTVASAVLNLLPLPGLVCGAIWPAFRPDREKRILRQEPILLGILAAAIVAGFVANPAAKLLPYFSGLA